MRKRLACRIEVGAPADLLVCYKIFGAAGDDAFASIQKGDLPGIGIVVIDGRIEVSPRSQQTPLPTRPPRITREGS